MFVLEKDDLFETPSGEYSWGDVTNGCSWGCSKKDMDHIKFGDHIIVNNKKLTVGKIKRYPSELKYQKKMWSYWMFSFDRDINIDD